LRFKGKSNDMKMKHQGKRQYRSAFTLIELLVVVVVIALLAALLLPALGRARRKALAVACASQMRQVWMSVLMYSQDWNGYSPVWYCGSGCTWSTWRDACYQYAPNTNIFRCPLIPKGGLFAGSYCNYGVNAYLSECYANMSMPLDRWKKKSETIALSENPDGDWVCEPRNPNCNTITIWGPLAGKPLPFSVSSYFPPDCPGGGGPNAWACEGRWYPWHDLQAPVCFLDGHVELMNPNQIHATVNGKACYYWIAK
jgi:prepilin-type N-terminal cleavage/methylation domain-containing protein/prepilin-type processing-associated H-X9-DG protein